MIQAGRRFAKSKLKTERGHKAKSLFGLTARLWAGRPFPPTSAREANPAALVRPLPPVTTPAQPTRSTAGFPDGGRWHRRILHSNCWRAKPKAVLRSTTVSPGSSPWRSQLLLNSAPRFSQDEIRPGLPFQPRSGECAVLNPVCTAGVGTTMGICLGVSSARSGRATKMAGHSWR